MTLIGFVPIPFKRVVPSLRRLEVILLLPKLPLFKNRQQSVWKICLKHFEL